MLQPRQQSETPISSKKGEVAETLVYMYGSNREFYGIILKSGKSIVCSPTITYMKTVIKIGISPRKNLHKKYAMPI